MLFLYCQFVVLNSSWINLSQITCLSSPSLIISGAEFGILVAIIAIVWVTWVTL